MNRLWLSILAAALVGSAFANDIQLPPETVALKPSPLPGYKIAMQKCGLCHSADYIAYQPPGMSLKQWTAEMTKMQKLYGAPIDDGEIKLLGIYLTDTYGDASTVTPADRATTPAADAGAVDVDALLSRYACLSCHAVNQKLVGPAYHDVALKYKDDPQALGKLEGSIRQGGVGRWGSVPMPAFGGLSDPELKALAAFVLQQ